MVGVNLAFERPGLEIGFSGWEIKEVHFKLVCTEMVSVVGFV